MIKTVKHTTIYKILTVASLIIAPLSFAANIEANVDTRDDLGLVIYNHNLALVNDSRSVDLPQGPSVLNFRAVSPQINPASAMLHPVPATLRIQRQHFQPVTTPGDLLVQSVGQMVTLVRTDPVSGQFSRERAKIISISGGLIFEIDGHFETDLAGRRIIYDQLPESVYSPTLRFDVDSTLTFQTPLSLSYLSSGLSWTADYVARLNPTLDSMQLRGLASLQNDSGIDFPDAKISLIAGSVNQVYAPVLKRREMAMMAADTSAAPTAPMAVADLQRYELPGRISLGNNSLWQVPLFEATEVPVKRYYRLAAEPHIYYSKDAPEQRLKVDSYIDFKNLSEHQLGIPLPAGTVRLYVGVGRIEAKGAEDQNQTVELSYIGEDHIAHTPEGLDVRLKTGQAFDLSATRRQLAFKRLPVEQPYRQHFEVDVETRLSNAGKNTVEVELVEKFGGEWVIKEGAEPDSSMAHSAIWKIPVPAQGEAVLKLKLRIKK